MKKYITTSFFWILLTVSRVFAQQETFQAQFYQNTFIINPAMAGIEGGLNLNSNFNYALVGMEGSPMLTSISADAPLHPRVAGGIQIKGGTQGIFQNYQAKLSAAYLLPLTEDTEHHHIRLGLSVGYGGSNINTSKIYSVNPASYSEARMSYAAVDVGVAYILERFTAQLVAPNIFFNRLEENQKTANLSLLYVATSYDFSPKYASYGIGPFLGFRKFSTMANVFDIGGRAHIQDGRIMLSYLYHTNNSSTIGMNFLHNEGVTFSFYATSYHSANQFLSNNAFEVGVAYNLPK